MKLKNASLPYLLTSCLAITAASCERKTEESGKPNIVMIAVDDLCCSSSTVCFRKIPDN